MSAMVTQLDHNDRRLLVQLLRDLPDSRTSRGQQALIENAVSGYPKSRVLLGNIEWEGSSMVFASDVVRLFENFEVADGVGALPLLVNAIEPLVSAAQRELLQALQRRQGWGAEPPAPPPEVWRDDRSSADLNRERIIGENTLRHINLLHKALRAANAVVRIAFPKQSCYGTGFMVGPDLVMTNHHVIGKVSQAAEAEFAFFYELDIAGHKRNEVIVGSAANGFLHTDPELDFSLIRLQLPPDFGPPLALNTVQVKPNQRVAIIQHPGGFYKKISQQNNFVAYADKRLIQYYTSTDEGSSGSPVFNEDFEVVGLHHSWIALAEPDPGQRYFRNQGSSMIAVLDALKTAEPALWSALTVVP